ncbi:MAG: hypothetical protein OXU75_09260 [Deltaproteobacteria bacterium]|nr:hypothetical protein [Deltaproteobacteria bacterium]
MNEKARALLQKLSEIRVKLLGLASDATEETRAALTTELVNTETAFQAALAEAPEAPEARGGGEGAEFRALEARVSPLEYLAAASEFRAATGPNAEYNQALKLPVNEFPLRLLAPPPPPEERTTTAVDVALRPHGWVDRLFAASAAMYLGADMVEVAPGSASFPVTTGGGTPAQRGKEQTTAAAAWTIGVTEVDPKRMTLHYEYAIEDDARVPGLEAALLRDMRMALTERVDWTIFNGDDGATPNDGDVDGIFGLADVDETDVTQADKASTGILAAFTNLLDGLYAVVPSDLRVVASVGADRLWRSSIVNSAAENQTVARFLAENGVMYRSRAGIDTATADGDYAAAVGLQRGIAGALKCAMWPSARIIRDPYTGADDGQVKLTIHALWCPAYVRKDNLKVLKFVT